jgi:dTDP-4-dehydrorhamnose reductase
MKILLLGAAGQVGHELVPLLRQRGETVALSRSDLDFADLDAVRDALARCRPQLIVNAAAYNEVDRAESEPEAAFRINAEAVAMLGQYAKDARAALIHYSTDFVFDGAKDAPYVETDRPNPLSVYGRSKLEGERALAEIEAPAVVLRTAWVYSLRRRSFVSMVLKLARERKELSLVTDQVGSPTYSQDLARATVAIIERFGEDPGGIAAQARGVYHAAGSGACTRAELGCATLELDPKRHEHTVERISYVTSDAFPAPAARPRYAALGCEKLRERFGVSLPPWRDALRRALSEPSV